MAYGFSAINTNGKLLITDNMENLHFVGKPTLQGNDSASENYDTFPQYGDASTYDSTAEGTFSDAFDDLDGRIIFTYTFTHAGTPLVFIKPTDYSRWHAVLTQSVSGTTWTIKVIASGTSTSNPPVLYCFVNAENSTGSSDNYGLIVYQANGDRAFDSRYSPLAVTGGGTITPPSDPTNSAGTPTQTGAHNSSSVHGWNYATLDHDFRSTNRYNSQTISGTYTNLMFSAPSIAQAVYERVMLGYKPSNIPWYEGGGTQDHYSTATWWVFYRNTFRIRNGYFDAGWTNLLAGYAFSSNHEGGGWFGGGSGGTSTGSRPYDPKTINLTSNAFLIADATRYN
jgi:hypothetical protein